MREGKENFNQILYNKKYNFQQKIKELNDEFSCKKSKKDYIKEIMESVPTKMARTINQTIKIIDEIVKIKKFAPEEIILEVTRSDSNPKKKSKSRYEILEAEFKYFKENTDKIPNNISFENLENNLKKIKNDKTNPLKSKKVYLYFKQLGINLYTGQKIDLDDLLNSKKYDIDHIIPQCLILDNSFDNLVLTDRESNQRIKQDTYPITKAIRNESNKKLWRFLHEKKLISDKKYNNLIRETKLSLGEISDFVNAQLNVINHSNRIIRDILKIKYPETKVIFSKSQYPSFLREEYHISKLRLKKIKGNKTIFFSENDAHHAVDAYLNIIAGHLLHSIYSNPEAIYNSIIDEKKSDYKKSFHMENVLLQKINSQKITSPDCNGYLADLIQNTCFKETQLITYALKDIDKAFYNSNIETKADCNNPSTTLIPIHTKKGNPLNDTKKYGGHNSSTTIFMYLISYKEIRGKKEIQKKRLVNVKAIDYALYQNENKLKEYIKKRILDEYSNKRSPLIDSDSIKFLRKVKNGTKAKYKNGLFRISSGNYKQIRLTNIVPLFIDKKFTEFNNSFYLKFAFRFINSLPSDKNYFKIKLVNKSKHNYTLTINKERNKKIFEYLWKFARAKCFDQIPYLINLRNLNGKENDFDSMSLSDQIRVIVAIITLFYNPQNNSNSWEGSKIFADVFKCAEFKPSLSIDGPITFINDSITGLYSSKETYL